MPTYKQQLFLTDGTPFKWGVPMYKWRSERFCFSGEAEHIEKFIFNENDCEIVRYAKPSDWTLQSNGQIAYGEFKSFDLYSTPRAAISNKMKAVQTNIHALEVELELKRKESIALYDKLIKFQECELQQYEIEKRERDVAINSIEEIREEY